MPIQCLKLSNKYQGQTCLKVYKIVLCEYFFYLRILNVLRTVRMTFQKVI